MTPVNLDCDPGHWPALTADRRSEARSGRHLLRVDLDAAGTLDPDVLSEDERARAERYVVAPPRRQFTICRTILRRLCGWLLDRDPRDLCFLARSNGKPHLSDDRSLEFNVSHSGHWGMIAWSWSSEVGVDIETCDTRLNWRGLARRFFAPEEQSALAALAPERQFAGFFRVWATKEAYLKATGDGLARSLASFVVSADPDAPPQLLLVRDDPDATAKWTATSVRPACDVEGVAFFQGPAEPTARWSWHPEGILEEN